VSVGGILTEIGRERGAQDAKWGAPHDVPNGTGANTEFAGLTFTEWRDAVQRRVDRQAIERASVMSHVLLEEVFEALAEDDDDALRAELIQVAAVAAKWVQIIDERAERDAS
jgi:hypothetical protein